MIPAKPEKLYLNAEHFLRNRGGWYRSDEIDRCTVEAVTAEILDELVKQGALEHRQYRQPIEQDFEGRCGGAFSGMRTYTRIVNRNVDQWRVKA